jgi:hypothetical protein
LLILKLLRNLNLNHLESSCSKRSTSDNITPKERALKRITVRPCFLTLFLATLGTFDQDSPHLSPSGDTFWASGDWVVSTEGTTPSGQHFGPTDEKGFFTVIFVREVDEWKVALEIWNRLKSYK